MSTRPVPRLPPPPPVPPVVALALPPNPALPQPESKNLRIVLQSIRAQSDVLEVQRFGCASLRELARESEDRAWLGRLGGIELVLNAMRSFQADTELQQSACGALGTLSYENPQNAQLVLDHGGVELVLRAMQFHRSCGKLQGFALCVLRLLMGSDANDGAGGAAARQLVVRLGGIEATLTALAEHRDEDTVQGSGCGVLGRLSACSSEDLANIAFAGGYDAATAALAAFPGSADVQAAGSALLGNLVLASAKVPNEFVDGPAVLRVIQALRHDSLEVQDCAANALNNICLRSPDCAARAAVSGAYASLGQVLRTPSLPGETDSSEWTRLLPMISVLHLLCRSGETDSHMDFVMSGGLMPLIVAMSHFLPSLKVQEQTSFILQSLGGDPEILQMMFHGGLEGMLNAMDHYPGAVRIQMSGCHLTSTWVMRSENAERVAEAGGVQLVVLAMKTHHLEVDIQVLGCKMLQKVADYVAKSPGPIAHFGGIEAVLQSLEVHAEDGLAQEQGVRALCSIARQDHSCRRRVVEYGLPKDPSDGPISKAESVRPDDGFRGKEVELWTLWNRKGPVPLLPGPVGPLQSMQEHGEHPLPPEEPIEPQQHTEELEEVAVAPPQLRGVPLLFRALLHPCGAVASALHAATCSLLAKLAADGDEYQALVLEEGGITAAVRSATIHAADPQVQVDAFDLLQNLVGRPLPTGPSNLVQLCTACGVVELILAALKTYPQHKEVLRSSVTLLRSLILGSDLSESEKTLAPNLEDALTQFEGFAEGMRVETFLQELRRRSADVATRSTAQGVVEILMKSLSIFKEARLQEVILVAYRELAANRRSRHHMTMRGTWKEIMAEVQAQRDEPTLQVFGCDLVELQTRDCEYDNIEDAIVFGGVESLLKVFEKHAANETVQQRSCVAAAKLAQRSADIKAMFVEGHLIQLIVEIMKLHRGSEVLQKLACVVLLSLVDHSEECRAETVQNHCLENACRALQDHPMVAELQEQALLLLATLAADGPEVRRRLAGTNGLMLTLHAMQVCIDSEEVQRESGQLLATWGEDDSRYFQEILDSDGLVPVVSGMQRHVECRRVQEEFSELMRLLANHSQEGRDKVIAAGGIEAMLDGMNANRKSDELAYRSCATLAILAKGNRAAVARIAKHNGAKHIVRAMLVSRDRADLQECALEALRAISADDEDVPGEISANGGVQFVCQALMDFKHIEAIQEHGLAALANLAWDSADNQLQIGELEGCEHAIEVLSLHKEPKVQAFGCALLQSVACNNPEMRTRIGEIGGVEAIVQAMQANPKAANVLAFGASALQSLATSNQDNVRRCHKLKVVDLVADAMEAHPFSVKLREFGEMLTNTIEG